jgi:hypothetical protein
MDVIKKRARLGWVLGLITLLAIFGWASAAKPTIDGATAGAIGRTGLIAAVAILPIVFAGRTMSKFSLDNATAAAILPIFIGGFLATLVYMFGFIPERPDLCAGFERHDIPLGPECFTSFATRLRELLEAVAMWVVFGAVLEGSFRMRERKAVRAAQQRSMSQA